MTYRSLVEFVPSVGVLVVIYTDNLGSKFALETGKTKDHTLAMCTREMWLEASINHHQVAIRHKPGEQLILADALSRQSKDPSKAAIVRQAVLRDNLIEIAPKLNNYVFFDLSL